MLDQCKHPLYKTVGVMGGMGVWATIGLFERLAGGTGSVKKEQDNLHILIDNQAHVPSRIDYILGHSFESPLPYLLASVARLERAGADFLIMPCNTAHHFLKQIREATRLPFLSIIDATLKEAHERGVSQLLLLASEATVKVGLYRERASHYGISIIDLADNHQKELNGFIGQVKLSDYSSLESFKGMMEQAQNSYAAEAEGVIGGCTEIPLLFDRIDAPLPLFDSLSTLARAAIRFAGASVAPF